MDTMTTDESRQQEGSAQYYFRHNLFQRLMHGVLMPTFVGLAATGLPLKFSEAGWSRSLARWLGGFDAILFFHKALASILILQFVLHVGFVLYMAIVKRERGVFWGPTSIVPQPRDFKEAGQHVRWFLRAEKRPHFGRWTYWEKFDYFAVFWGMAIIGGSGIVMWFSGFFANFLPGQTFNIALIIHSEEALLAVGFIFTIHIFNTHIRPEKFPMDMVIFTGRETMEELREDRPAEYQRLVAEDKLDMYRADPPPLWLHNFGRLIGITIVVAGVTIFVLSIVAVLAE
jgi:thiosulfate reductase cytochrome b subunit